MQQHPGADVIEMCFGPLNMPSPLGSYAEGCPGVVVDNYTWPMPPTAVESEVGRIANVFAEGTLSADRSTFHIDRDMDMSSLSASQVAAAQIPRTVPRPSDDTCSAKAPTYPEYVELLSGELAKVPIALNDAAGGVQSDDQLAGYEISAAFVVDDTFTKLCAAGIGLDDITVFDQMRQIP